MSKFSLSLAMSAAAWLVFFTSTHGAEPEQSFSCESGVEIPEWRGKTQGTAYLGPDVLWRTREMIVFHMLDEEGGGFELDLTLRDMNTYMQGPRPVMIRVVGPGDKVVAHVIVEDDGHVAGNDRYRDGIYDPGQDFRFRHWHRVNSPDGVPPGTERSPFLETPEKLAPRRITLPVEDAGPGLYRASVTASWDHWVSVTPDRPLITGVHSGTGPFYIHGDRFEEAYLYVPPIVEDIGISVSEEVEPYNWSVELAEADGEVVASFEADGAFWNYLKYTPEEGGKILTLRATGETTGAHMHVVGVPALLAPDAETAERLGGGIEIDDKGRITFHHHQRVLNEWIDSLTPEDLEVRKLNEEELAALPRALRRQIEGFYEFLDDQNLDPEDPEFGHFSAQNRRTHEAGPQTLLRMAGNPDPDNPYYGDAAVLRRALLGRRVPKSEFSPSFFWERHNGALDMPQTVEIEGTRIFQFPFRNNYYDFLPDHLKVHQHYVAVKDALKEALPEEVVEALRTQLELGLMARSLQHTGESSNKWANAIHQMHSIALFLGEPEHMAPVWRNVELILTPGILGRSNPDPTPFVSEAGPSGAADVGMTGAQYLSEHWGFDYTYTTHAGRHFNEIWLDARDTPLGDIIEEQYFIPTYELMAHLSLLRDGRPPEEWETSVHTNSAVPRTRMFALDAIVSPTDMASRERGGSFETFLDPEAAARIPYADLWASPDEAESIWPMLEEEPFTRVFDNTFYFIKTPTYYSIHYGGPTSPAWRNFNRTETEGTGGNIVGYHADPRDLLQWKSNKPGGLSAVWVENAGPTLFGHNRDVRYANVVWGRAREAVVPGEPEEGFDPQLVSSGFVDPVTEFNEESRVYRKVETLQHAPLEVIRTIRFRDDAIDVRLEVVALEDVELLELYETLPFMAEERTLRLFGAELESAGEIEAMSLVNGSLEEPVRAFEIGTPGGAGAVIVMDQAYPIATTEPFAFSGRSRAPATASFSLGLEPAMEAGQKQVVRYTIVPVQEPVEESWLREQAETLATGDAGAF